MTVAASSTLMTPSYSGALRGFVLSNLFAGEVSGTLAERLQVPYQLATEEVQADGGATDEDSSQFDVGRAAFFAVVGISLLFSLFFSSGYLLNALVEEKENRVMEVLLSSVKPDALLLGKFFGLGGGGADSDGGVAGLDRRGGAADRLDRGHSDRVAGDSIGRRHCRGRRRISCWATRCLPP